MLRPCPWVGVFIGLSVWPASVGPATADEFSAVITKVDADKVSFRRVAKGKKTDGVATLPVADAVRVVRAEFDPAAKKYVAGPPLNGGLKSEVFAKIGEAGVGVRIITGDDNQKIAAILVIGRK